MPIVVACSCGKKYQVGDDKAGMKMRCKACQAVIPVPVPKTTPADDFDDFGGNDFGGGDDFGGSDDFGDQGEPIAPRPKSTGKKSGAKSKGKAKGGGKKSSKGKEMSPAVKYSVAGGIVVVTAGIVLGILYARGVIGGKKKDTDSGGSSGSASGELAGGDAPGGGALPGAGGPGGPGPGNYGRGRSKTNSPAAQSKWTPTQSWTPSNDLLTQTTEPQKLEGSPDYQLRIPKSMKPVTDTTKIPVKADPTKKLYMWTEDGRTDDLAASLLAIVAMPPSGQQFPPGVEQSSFENMAKAFNESKAKYTATTPNGGRINGIAFQRIAFFTEIEVMGKSHSVAGFKYLGMDRNRTVLISFIASDLSSNAEKSLPVMEAAVLSFQRLEAQPKTQQPSTQTPSPAAIAAADLVKQNPVDSKTLEKKTIRVQGTVAAPLDQQGWLYLTGDGRRTVACNFTVRPASIPVTGQVVVVEGTFFQSLAQFVTMGNCKVVSAGPAPKGSQTAGKPVAKKPLGKTPVGDNAQP